MILEGKATNTFIFRKYKKRLVASVSTFLQQKYIPEKFNIKEMVTIQFKQTPLLT